MAEKGRTESSEAGDQGARSRNVAVVTGGGAGIGKACCRRFAREGWAVVVGDLSERDGQAVASDIAASGGEAILVRADVGRPADCDALAEAALDRFGRIDALIANAGARVGGSILDATEADWQKIIAVNFRGVSDSCRAVLPTMIEQRTGSIVIVSSANALVGRAGMPLYDATKAAVLSLARSLAVAHGKDGVRVNAVCPGYTMTDFHERRAAREGQTPQQLRERNQGYALLGRPAEPEELANGVWFLASEEGAMVTGQSLFIDGGLSVTSAAR